MRHGQSTHERVTRLLTFVLRHQPDKFGIDVDAAGWASADLLLNTIQQQAPRLRLWSYWSHVDLERFVATQTHRFELRRGRIRARYGHSLSHVVVGVVRRPPQTLLHGTTNVYIGSVRMLGLRAYNRTAVHLTSNLAYAEEVADSNTGRPITLAVRAREAWDEGITFRQATEHVWLVEAVPVQFIRFIW